MLKDAKLAQLASQHNVARYLSFSPEEEPRVRHAVLGEGEQIGSDATISDAIRRILELAPSVNVRTFRDAESKSTPFVYGIKDWQQAAATVRTFAQQGYYTIVNETIDIHDGGVSGVSVGGVTEFAPAATPRVVEDPEANVARLPTRLAHELLCAVYGFTPTITPNDGQRLEFSVHPLRVGTRKEHTLVWELSDVPHRPLSAAPRWPNAFSRFMGDKPYGLLLAHLSGLRVPRTTVVSRNVAPFSFGETTGTQEYWMRTAPATATPGHFTTVKGWTDPFSLLQQEDPGKEVVSVLAQEGVRPLHSGGALSADGGPLIEGVAGRGDPFMLGKEPEDLPQGVRRRVSEAVRDAERTFGSVQIEWVDDGTRLWIVQLHERAPVEISAGILNQGRPKGWLSYDPADGVDALRELVKAAAADGLGIELTRPVGVTSHFGDILRSGGVPGRIRA